MGKKADNKKQNKIDGIIHDERFKLTAGLFFLFLALFAIMAFVSYFFTWKSDHSFEWSNVVSGADITVENWAGKTGARLANLFINNWFGLGAFVLPFILAVIGIRLLGYRMLPLRKTIRISIIAGILLSLLLGYLFGDFNGYLGSGLGGSHGYLMSEWLNAFLGKIGTGLLLFILIFAFITFSFKQSTEWLKKISTKILSLTGFARFDKTGYNEFSDTEEQNVADNDAQQAFDEDLIFETEKNLSDDDYIARETAINNEQDIETENKKDDDEEDVELTIEEQKEIEDTGQNTDNETMEDYDPTLDLSDYKLPPIDLLDKHDDDNIEVTNEELINNKNRIVETLGNYKIQINKIKATIGPTVTLYEIVPAPGIRISKIKNLEDDIALSLAALGIRIIAPIPGKGTIGIEVPNQNPQIVSMRSIMNSKKFQESKAPLTIGIGKTISNETFVFDLAKMPHLLVAGATGQGKSVGLNAIITSLLYKKHPAQLKFVFIDPKKVELSIYAKIEKHFLAKLPGTEEPIITDTQKVINTLNSLTIEMDNRYSMLKDAHTKNLAEYNAKFIARKLNPEKGHRYLPYIVLVIDEFADLIMTAGKEIENPLARLAQLARAIGIHLVIATQRPTTNIITGVIKANFPARIAFKVTSMIDSRTILDQPGANQLIGRGDMLISSGSELVRIQCAFIDTHEIEDIIDFIGKQQGYPEAYELPEYSKEDSDDIKEVDLKKRDEMFDEAARLMVIHQQGSTSLIQRKFSIGYNRAGRIVDQLEAAGIVGPFEGSKARQVLIQDEYSLEQLLNDLNK